jgi:hypothetical protein
VLSFLAEHRLVLASHVEALTGACAKTTHRRLRTLADARYLSYRPFLADQPDYCQITPKGLAAIGSSLPPPKPGLVGYRHDVGVAWLWLAARQGAFGAPRQVIGERRMRSEDRRREWPEEPYGVRLGGYGRDGRERLHYPDLLVVGRDGLNAALELELSGKGSTRREQILGAYGADSRIDRVLYLVEDTPSGRAIERLLGATARSVGVSDRVQIRHVRPLTVIHGEERHVARPRTRAAGAGSRSRAPGAEAQEAAL